MDLRSIGIFDSGVGGLTVLREIIEQLPFENIVYFGDTARIPYGTKSDKTVMKYAQQCGAFLMMKNVKAIVIACNTASAVALSHLQDLFDIPIIGVIDPGAKSAALATKNNKIGVLGTTATINSGAYQEKIIKYKHDAEVIGIACPLFVPIVEEGWHYSKVAEITAEKYLTELSDHNIDTLVLGCTHYPILRYTIKKAAGKNVKLINPAFETAKDLKKLLIEKDLLCNILTKPNYEYFVSDAQENFKRTGGSFLKREIENIVQIDIDNL